MCMLLKHIDIDTPHVGPCFQVPADKKALDTAPASIKFFLSDARQFTNTSACIHKAFSHVDRSSFNTQPLEKVLC